MGQLSHFDVFALIEAYGCVHFIETGSGIGQGLRFAMLHPFASLISSEIESELAETLRLLCARDPRVQVLCGASEQMLAKILLEIPQEQPILFWLDAHFPGADYMGEDYAGAQDENLRLPLERELELIRIHRGASLDVILIDDLRIYEQGSFGAGNVPDHVQTLPAHRRNIDFVYRLFVDSHIIERDHHDEGYLMLKPIRQRPRPEIADVLARADALASSGDLTGAERLQTQAMLFK